MKHLSLGCVALFIVFGSAAQPQPPSLNCPDPITWNGLDSPVDNPVNLSCPCEVYAETGTYMYWMGASPLYKLPLNPACIQGSDVGGNPSYNQSYGLKIHERIGNPSGVFLDMEVFETKLSLQEGELQYWEDPVATFTEGDFRFNTFFIAAGTEVVLQSGVNLEITGQLRIESGATLTIQEGASVKLLSTATETAYIDVNGGTIDGLITKQVFIKRNSGTNNLSGTANVYSRFAINPGLYEVDLDAVARSVQEALQEEFINGDPQKPTVQIGTWVTKDVVEDYGYFANHSYYNENASFPAQAKDLGTNVLTSNGHVTFGGLNPTLSPMPTINQYSFTNNVGVSILPIYTDNANTLSNFLENPQFLSLSNGAQTASPSVQSQYATTPEDQLWPLVISVTDADPSITEFTIEITGKYIDDTYITLKNYATVNNSEEVVVPGYATFTAITVIDTIFNNSWPRMPLLNIPVYEFTNNSGFTFPGIYSENWGYNGKNANYYRNIQMNGFNIINNHLNAPISLKKLAQNISSVAPNSQLAFYDIRPLIPEMEERQFDYEFHPDNPQSNVAFEINTRTFQMPIVANFMKLHDGSLVDIYNIPGTEVYTGIGDTLNPHAVVGFNFDDPTNSQEYYGQSQLVNLRSAAVHNEWINGNNNYSPIWTDPYNEYADQPSVHYHDIADVRTIKNEVQYNTYKTSANPVNPTVLDADAWHDLSKFTLLRLNGVTSLGETTTLCVIPLVFDPASSMYTDDVIETSVAPHPGFHVYADEYQTSIKNRMRGAYTRTSNYNEPLDSIIVVFNKEYWNTGEYTSFFLDAPIVQTEQGCWHWSLGTESPYGLNDQISPGWTYSIPEPIQNQNYGELVNYGAGPSSGELESFNGYFLTLYPCDLCGDLQQDNLTSASDLIQVLAAFNTAVEDNFFNGDFNGDGFVSTSDLLVFFQAFGTDCYGPSGGTPASDILAPTVQDERILFLTQDHNNEHIVYDFITQYPGLSAQQQLFFADIQNLIGTIVVTDEFGWIVHVQHTWDYQSGIQLRSSLPTSQQLIDSNTGSAALEYPAGYQIHFMFPDGYVVPGFTNPVTHMCLGCQYGDDQILDFKTYPVFTAN